MNKSNATVATQKGMSTLARPKFAPGMLLQHEDLEQLTYYTRDLSRLLFRSLFGCGVMCGLVVETKIDCGKLKIIVAPGLALSCSGDPIEVPDGATVWLDKECHPDMGKTLWVKLCGTVKCCAPRTSMCESDDDETKSECTREREGFEISVESARPPCICGCPEPKTDIGQNHPDTQTQTGQTPIARPMIREGEVADCKCADPADPCYEKHYLGECGCHCDDCKDCDCKCILLARLTFNEAKKEWETDHSVRRFIRPVLMRDPKVDEERSKKTGGEGEKPQPEPPPPPAPPPPPTGGTPERPIPASAAAARAARAARTPRTRTSRRTAAAASEADSSTT